MARREIKFQYCLRFRESSYIEAGSDNATVRTLNEAIDELEKENLEKAKRQGR